MLEEYEILNGTLGQTNKIIREHRDIIEKCTKDLIKSNERLSKSQDNHSKAIIILTAILCFATALQTYLVFWTAQPQRSIETIKALNEWSSKLQEEKSRNSL